VLQTSAHRRENCDDSLQAGVAPDVARSFARHGVTKLRLTGGEPLLRRGLGDHIARLAVIPGIDDLAMTTNGALLERKAAGLAAAGLRRVTVSLDSLDDAVFMAMNGVVEPVEPSYAGEVATRWRYRDGTGEVGVIGSVAKPLCGDCTRARLSAEGMLYTCLFAASGTDLRELVRSIHDGGTGDEALDERVHRLSSDRHRPASVEMSHIGG